MRSIESLTADIARRERFIQDRRTEIDQLRSSGSRQDIALEEISGKEDVIKDFEQLNNRDRKTLEQVREPSIDCNFEGIAAA